MLKVAILLFIMQFNSMLAVGLGWVGQSEATIIRICVGSFLIYNYIKTGVFHVSFYIFMLVMICFYFANGMPLIINFIFASLMIYSIRNEESDSIIKGVYYSTIFLSCIFIVISLNGIIHPTILFSPDTGRYRNSLGFISPNYPGLIAFSNIISLFTCLGIIKNNVGRWSKFIVYLIIIFCLIIPLVTDSRTPLYTLILSMVFFLLMRFTLAKKSAHVLLPLIPGFFMALTLYIAFNYSNALDVLLSGRPYLYSLYLKNADWMIFFFGGEGEKGFSVDSSYLLLLSCFGLFVFLIFAVLIHRTILFNNNKYILTAIFSILVYGMSESIMVRPEISVVFLFYCLFALKTDIIGSKSSNVSSGQ